MKVSLLLLTMQKSSPSGFGARGLSNDLSNDYLDLKKNLITVFNISSYLLILSSIKNLFYF